MKVFLRIVAAVCVLLAAGLIYAVIHAVSSAGGAKPVVAVLYVIGAILLVAVAGWLWRVRGGRKAAVTSS